MNMSQQASLQQLVAYQKRCYEADNRELGIINLMHSKNRHVRFLDGVESAICGTLPRIAMPQNYAENLRKESHQNRRDKSLVYAAFSIVGTRTLNGSTPQTVCAPLIYVNCEFEQIQGNIFLAPDLDSARINTSALAQIAESVGGDREKLDTEFASLSSLPWDRTRVHVVAAKLAELLPGVDFTPLSGFPQLVGKAEVHACLDSEEADLVCMPTATVALIPNSPETRGVLYELDQLSTRSQFSHATRLLFGHASDSKRQAAANERKPTRWPVAPGVLSEAQLRVTQASASTPITMVVGPPGTGKSHTIACVALDHIARNETVLIASRSDQAVDVAAAKIESLIGSSESVIRAGRKEHLRELKRKLGDLLQGISTNACPDGVNSRQLRQTLSKLDSSLGKTERDLQRQMEREIRWGAFEVQPPRAFWNRIAGKLRQRIRQWTLADADLWRQVEWYGELSRERSEVVQRYLGVVLYERVQRLLKKRRADLTKFLQAIRARSDGKQQNLFAEVNFSALLHTFPVWLCKLTDLANVLPFQSELFDVAILDEATQCDIASCLPLFHRAKRVVVVGDPKQLSHISFLPESRQQAIASEFQLSDAQQDQFHFRRRSILDALSDSITDQRQVVFLNEHFRSLPDIIGFSNRHFYNGALSVMRQRPGGTRDRCVQIYRTPGQRDKRGSNPVEAEQLVHDVIDRIGQHSETPSLGQRCPTIGVLSPFREQVDLLTQMIQQRIDFAALERHDLLVGTAHSFQGEERDVMYLSWAVDQTAHAATWRYLNSPNILNVAVTRARDLQFFYTSFDPMELPPQTLLRQLLTESRAEIGETSANSARVDPFRQQLIEYCTNAGWKTWSDYPFAGQAIDLVIQSADALLAIDLVGYPGHLAKAFTLQRYLIIRRAGINLLPLSYREWLTNKQQAMHRIHTALSNTPPVNCTGSHVALTHDGNFKSN